MKVISIIAAGSPLLYWVKILSNLANPPNLKVVCEKEELVINKKLINSKILVLFDNFILRLLIINR